MPQADPTTSSTISASDSEHRATRRVGIVGARGYVGAELLRLIERHPRLEIAFASSRSHAGRAITDIVPETGSDDVFVEPSPELIAALEPDVCVLAMPDGAATPFADAFETYAPAEGVLIDLSSDHRFVSGWTYGLPELNESAIRRARRIANPGCYATAMMLALAPIAESISGPAHAFGISGYSGAGTTPSPRNDPSVLADNVIPYALVDHVHEREVSHHLGHPVRFVPHVAPFFRGIAVTISAALAAPARTDELVAHYGAFYQAHPLVRVSGAEIPFVRDAADQVHATIGGIAVNDIDGRHISIVATLDNLLKGAASQAIQNINLACGFNELEGLAP